MNNINNSSESGKITDVEKEYLKTILGSIKRSRGLLIAISILSVWLIASQVITLMAWQNIRTPASINIVDSADNKLSGMKIYVPADALRQSDRIIEINGGYVLRSTISSSDSPNYVFHLTDNNQRYEKILLNSYHSSGQNITEEYLITKNENYPDSISIELYPTPRSDHIIQLEYPVDGDFREKADWCKHYLRFILDQKNKFRDIIFSVEMIIDRASVSDTKLPKDFIDRPSINVPVVGLTVALDDLHLVGAIILLLMMFWLRYSFYHIFENIIAASAYYEANGSQNSGFLKKWIPLQFIFIRSYKNKPVIGSPASVYILFMIPYITILFSLCIDIYDMAWQITSYSFITGSSWYMPLFGDSSFFLGDAVGILLLRWGVFIIILWVLQRQGGIVWNTLENCRDYIEFGATKDKIRSERKNYRRKAFFTINLIVIGIMITFTLIRIICAYYSVSEYGWSYGPNFIGSSVLLIVIIGFMIWLKLKRLDVIDRLFSDQQE